MPIPLRPAPAAPELFSEEELTRIVEPLIGKTRQLCGRADAGQSQGEAAGAMAKGLLVIMGESREVDEAGTPVAAGAAGVGGGGAHEHPQGRRRSSHARRAPGGGTNGAAHGGAAEAGGLSHLLHHGGGGVSGGESSALADVLLSLSSLTAAVERIERTQNKARVLCRPRNR